MSCDCKLFVILPHDAMGWSTVYDCGIFLSYSHIFLTDTPLLFKNCVDIEDVCAGALPRMEAFQLIQCIIAEKHFYQNSTL